MTSSISLRTLPERKVEVAIRRTKGEFTAIIEAPSGKFAIIDAANVLTLDIHSNNVWRSIGAASGQLRLPTIPPGGQYDAGIIFTLDAPDFKGRVNTCVGAFIVLDVEAFGAVGPTEKLNYRDAYPGTALVFEGKTVAVAFHGRGGDGDYSFEKNGTTVLF